MMTALLCWAIFAAFPFVLVGVALVLRTTANLSAIITFAPPVVAVAVVALQVLT